MDISNTPPTKGNSTAALWVILAVVIVIILGAFYYYMQKTEPFTNSNVVVTNRVTNTNAVANANSIVDTSGWDTYTNDQQGFSLKHPDSWTVRTITTDTLNYDIGDSMLSKGLCNDNGCSINTDICEIAMSDEPDSSDSPITDIKSWIAHQPFYKGNAITQVRLGIYSALQTKVAVTPSSNGSQGMGTYFIIATNTPDAFLSATLVKGFDSDNCIADMSAILSTITQ